jgi:hypothetical protein
MKSHSGEHHFPNGGKWVPEGKPAVVGFRPNPSDWSSWGRPTKAILFVGLEVGRETGSLKEGDKIPPRWVYGTVFDVRTSQVGKDYGSSFIQQKGHYIPPEAEEPGPEPKRRESSMQVILFPAFSEDWETFRTHVRVLATELLDELGQKSIIGEFMKNGITVEVGSFKWVPSKRKK